MYRVLSRARAAWPFIRGSGAIGVGSFVRLSALVFAVSAFALVQGNSAGRGADLASLTRLINAGRVQSVEILYVPPTVVRAVNMTPDGLRKGYRYKIIIQDFAGSKASLELASALGRTEVHETGESADVTFGVVFRVTGGSVREVYMDGFGRLGLIDGSAVSFKGKLYEWLHDMTAPLK